MNYKVTASKTEQWNIININNNWPTKTEAEQQTVINYIPGVISLQNFI